MLNKAKNKTSINIFFNNILYCSNKEQISTQFYRDSTAPQPGS